MTDQMQWVARGVVTFDDEFIYKVKMMMGANDAGVFEFTKDWLPILEAMANEEEIAHPIHRLIDVLRQAGSVLLMSGSE